EQERKQLAQEREKNEQMMQKLLEIQAQLTGQSASMNTVSFTENIIESKDSENPAKSETDNPDS
ncbi:MAG: hypothetical protein K6B52_08910, partial [Clostridiales bacterium]|nr:hypothetical protein [Clostridiales bacterium]